MASGWDDIDVAALPQLVGTTEGWWLSGGRALDAWLGQTTRRHGDTDIGCFREDLPALIRSLPGWSVFEAHQGTLTALPRGQAPRAEVTSLWCHRPDAHVWTLQVMLEALEEGRWTYRRDRRVTADRSAITWRSEVGFSVYRPEIQLLYKARAPRAKDRADFDAVTPHLPRRAASWLLEALETAHPSSPWCRLLRDRAR